MQDLRQQVLTAAASRLTFSAMETVIPPADDGGYVSTAYVRSLFDYLSDAGVSPADLFGSRATAAVERQDAFGRISAMEWVRLFSIAERATGNPCIALRVGEAIKPRHFGILGYVTMSCADLREAIDRLLRYEALVGELSQSSLSVRSGQAYLRWCSPLKPVPPRVLAETSMAGWVTYGRWLLGDYPISGVSFQHEAAADLSEYQRIFRCPVRFGADHTGIHFPEDYLDRPIAQHDPDMRALLDAQAEARLNELRRLSRLHGDARQAARQALMAGQAGLEYVALIMGLSGRTLERRLRHEGLSFRSVMDEARLQYARELLASPDARLSEIALLLGYSEQSAFSRAFRRWTGSSPARYRASLLGRND